MISVPGRSEPQAETWNGLIADYYCPIDESTPYKKKGHIPVVFHHDSCIAKALEESQETLKIMEEVYESPMRMEIKKLNETEDAIRVIARAIAGNTK